MIVCLSFLLTYNNHAYSGNALNGARLGTVSSDSKGVCHIVVDGWDCAACPERVKPSSSGSSVTLCNGVWGAERLIVYSEEFPHLSCV